MGPSKLYYEAHQIWLGQVLMRHYPTLLAEFLELAMS